MGAAFRITTTINPTKTPKKRKASAKTTKSKAKAKATKPKKKPGPPRRATTGDHDWQIVFSRDGGQIAVRGPYATKRAALADAKVVVRARIPEDIALIKETDVYGKETGYAGEDGSFSAEVIPSTGEVTNTDDWRRYNPSARNPAKPKKQYRYRSDDDPRTPYYSYAEKNAQKVFSKAFDGRANVVYSGSSHKPTINSMDESKGHIPLWFGGNPQARMFGFFGVIQAEKGGYLFSIGNREVTSATGTPEAAFTLMLAQARPWLAEHLRLYFALHDAKSAVWAAKDFPRGQRGKLAAIAAAEAAQQAAEQDIVAHAMALPHHNPRRSFGRMR